MAKVRLEVMAWLARDLAHPDSSFIVLEEEVTEGETVGGLLQRLAKKSPVFRDAIYDPETGGLSPAITVVHNELLLDLTGGLRTRLSDGDRLIFFPAFAGGQYLLAELPIR